MSRTTPPPRQPATRCNAYPFFEHAKVSSLGVDWRSDIAGVGPSLCVWGVIEARDREFPRDSASGRVVAPARRGFGGLFARYRREVPAFAGMTAVEGRAQPTLQPHDAGVNPASSVAAVAALAVSADDSEAAPAVTGGQPALPAFRRHSFSVSSGTTLNRSPTRPMSATWKIGASSSLLIATMTLESFMPARCWIAPEMPTAI